MLRTKQLGTLSQSARSFFLSGSRCNAADGSSSCTCSEDDACVSGKHNTRNAARVPKASLLASRASARRGYHPSGDAVKPPAASPQVKTASRTSGKTDSVSYASVVDGGHNDMTHSSPPVTDQFVRAGIAAVGFLSDLVNYKIPLSDGSGIIGSSQNHVVERVRPISRVKSSDVKALGREKNKGNSSTVVEPVSSSTSNSRATTKVKAENVGSVTGVKIDSQIPNNRNMQSSEKQKNIPSDFHDRRRPMPQKAKAQAQPNHFTTNVRNSEGRFVEDTTEGFYRQPKVARKPAPVVSPISRQFTTSWNVVERFSYILRQQRGSSSTEVALSNLNCPIDAFQANQVLKQLHDHTVALDFFYWLKRRPGFKHDSHTYTTMVGILGRARQFREINKLLDQMVREGCQPNVVTYNRLIHSYGSANYLREAVDVFNQMQEVGCEPDRVTYSTLMDIHAKAGYLDTAMDYYQKMQEAGIPPDTFTYGVVINCTGKAGHLDYADQKFREMVNQGFSPNLVTYNTMIDLHAKARNYKTSEQLYYDLLSVGFEPDNFTYNTMMQVLGHSGKLEEAEAVYREMKRNNWVPDEHVYCLLIDLWGKAGNAEKSWEWYCAMIDAGLRPNVPTCNSLLSAFLRVHRLSDAYNLLQNMLRMGLNPSLQTYTLLISCCTEAQTPFDMTFCCQLMSVTGHPAHTFLLSMPSAGPDGQNVKDHMSNFLGLMHSEDRESKRGLVDAVVDFLHKSGLKEEAGSVWEVAAQNNVYPDAVREKSSSYWLINLHVMSDGTAVTALSRTLAWFRRKMLVSGVSPSRIDIVTGWGRRSRVTGSSMVRQSVRELLNVFQFPFVTENGNSGCFVGCGEPLSRWLLQSYVERMHLL